MIGKKIQFSQKALEKNTRNTGTYVLSGVKSCWTWVLLSVISLLFCIMLFWGFYGSMVETVSGTGVTMLASGSRPVIAGGTGIISHLNIDSGSLVRSEQIIGQIYSPATFFNVQKQESEYELFQAQITFLSDGIKRLSAHKVTYDSKKKVFLDYLSGEHEKGKARAVEVADLYAKLKETGVVSKMSYYERLEQRVQTESEMVAIVLQNIDREWENEATLWELQQKLLDLRQRQESKEQELKLAQSLYKESYWIRAGFSGRVREIYKENGAHVQEGEPIALIDSDLADGLYLVAFVSAEQGNKIKTGMSAFFSPASLPASDYGFLRCIVRDISTAPVSAESIQAEVMNKSLTQMIASSKVMVRVVLDIIPDAQTVSHFKWTSQKGAPSEITKGMIGQLIINTEYRTPASYLIPGLRKFFRGDTLAKGHRKE